MTGAVYLLDKKAGITSRKAAGETAKNLNFRKYGHCGTLDPDATGLLVVLLGRATRLAPSLSGESKRYSFELVTGVGTDTLDMTGEVTAREDSSGITAEMVVEALRTVTGTFLQQVPLFSAVRVGGKRGYKLAREGETPEMPVRTVSADHWTHGVMSGGRIPLEVTVSTGTYVRALARDIGKALNIPASADSIRRTMSGAFSVSEASVLPGEPEAVLTMANAAARVMPTVGITAEEALRVVHGMEIQGNCKGDSGLVDPNGELIAIGTGDGETIRPRRVFAREEEL